MTMSGCVAASRRGLLGRGRRAVGLGKTVQVLSAMRTLFRGGEVRSVLVPTPRSMLATWENELTRWAPELSRLRVTPGNGREGVGMTGAAPEAIERTKPLELLPAQRCAYEKVLERARSGEHTSDDTLRVINELPTVCAYDPTTGASAKLERSAETLEAVRAAGAKILRAVRAVGKAVVFSTLIRPLELLEALLAARNSPH